ncbi:MAG: toxin-antitoxin system HicB family antitoxin [Oscillospiraceae bacterium]|nr:toxin-antitoxin system HicB family antitoxin [Oscillospiraceae bacterium]
MKQRIAFTLRLEPELHRQIKERAEQEHRTLAQHLIELIKADLKKAAE